MHRTLFAVAIALTLSAGSLAAAPAVYKEPLDAQTLNTIKLEFDKLMQLANRHDFETLHGMFWQSSREESHSVRKATGTRALHWASRGGIR